MKTSYYLPLIALAAVGCAVDEDAPTERESAYDRASAEVVPTLDDAAELLGGYNSVFDRSLPSCLLSEDKGAPISVGNLEEKYEIKLANSRSEVSKDLNVNLGLGLHLPKIELLPTFNLTKQVKNSKTSVSFVMSAQQGYNVVNRRTVKLTTEALDAAKRSPTDFLKKCGNDYVHGLRYQADLLVLIRFDTMSEEKTREIAAGLSGKAPVGGTAAGIDANLQTTLKNYAKSEGVSASVHVASTGFIASGNSDAATFTSLGTALTDETFAKIDQLRDAMARSVRNDVCRDGDIGTNCNGASAPGYEKNTLRTARLASIVTRGYENTTDEIDFATFRGNINKLKEVEIFLGGVAKIGDAMEIGRDDEILPVVTAAKENLSHFNVMGHPRVTAEDVLDHAKKYAALFSGESGSALERVRNVSEDCASYGLAGDYTRCNAIGTSSALSSPKAALAAYRNERLVPLHFSPTASSSMSSAVFQCARIKTLGEGPRLITQEEAEYVAPLLREGGTGDAWFTNGSGCGGSSYFDADARPGEGFKCFDPGWKFWESKKAVGICVPKEGLVGELAPL